MYDLSGVPTRDAKWITDEQHGDIRRSIQTVPPGYVKLYHPRSRGLVFGRLGTNQRGSDETNIRFGVVEPHFAIVKASHVALDPENPDSIWRRENTVVLVAVGAEVEEGETVSDDSEDEEPKPTRRRTVR